MPIIVILFLNRIGVSIPGHIPVSFWVNRAGGQGTLVSHLSGTARAIPTGAWVGIRDSFHQLMRNDTSSNISCMVMIGRLWHNSTLVLAFIIWIRSVNIRRATLLTATKRRVPSTPPTHRRQHDKD